MVNTRKISFSTYIIHSSQVNWKPISEATPTWNVAGLGGRGGSVVKLFMVPKGCCQRYQMSHPLTFHCPSSQVDLDFERLETHTIWEAHFKEKDIKLKI